MLRHLQNSEDAAGMHCHVALSPNKPVPFVSCQLALKSSTAKHRVLCRGNPLLCFHMSLAALQWIALKGAVPCFCA